MTKDEIRAILGDAVQEDGKIDGWVDGGAWVVFPADRGRVILDGTFSPDELEAIAAHMRAQGGK